LSYSVPVQNGLKQGDALSPLLFNFTLEYVLRKVQENQVGLKLKGTHQHLTYADNMNLLEDAKNANIDAIKKNTETLIDACKEVGIKVEKTKYVTASSPEQTNQNLDEEEIKRRLKFYLLVCCLKKQ
jgi:hypothetical protein